MRHDRHLLPPEIVVVEKMRVQNADPGGETQGMILPEVRVQHRYEMGRLESGDRVPQARKATDFDIYDQDASTVEDIMLPRSRF